MEGRKTDSFTIINMESGKTLFECNRCGRHLATKQTVLKHLHIIHQMSPVKKVKKLYLDDPTFPIPKSTFYRHAAKKRLLDNTDETFTEVVNKSKDQYDIDLDVSPREMGTESIASTSEQHGCQMLVDNSVTSTSEQHGCQMLVDNSVSIGGFEADTCILDSDAQYNTDYESISYFESEGDSSSDIDHDSSSEIDSDSSSEIDSDSSSEIDSSSAEESDDGRNKQKTVMCQQKINSMCYLSCITRHNLTEACANDILQLIRIVSQDLTEISLPESYKATVQTLSDAKFQCHHYCNICGEVFPDDNDIYKCQTVHCTGFRYKGNERDQVLPSRQPCCKFIITDIKSQLVTLLSNTVVWSDIQTTKETMKRKQDDDVHGDQMLHDITDGECYRYLCGKGQFLEDPCAISGIFNTDGIPLYSSTKEKLWPIFLAVNEINIERRFLRENMILAGIWQGKKNPPFFQYLSAFSEAISKLYFDGFQFQGVHMRFGVLLGSVDLQAKSYVLNMTMHNGAYGCVTCEEPGKTVPSGRGHARYYPYRKNEEKFPARTNDDFVNKSIDATNKKRILGICGPSGLIALPTFDLIVGIVPDYMHCVLLGITKSLLLKYFSPTNSGKPYFIGKSLDHISRRLKNIKPPDYLDRLPRDLAVNYQSLKASELQAWLLYYCVPCLKGYLPEKYLRHLATLSEGIYICLSDSISANELQRAQSLLDSFYKDFAELYSEGSCGLNVHNVGAHLCFYVKQWGPLFGWSCFGFEDGNAELLSFAHGTGDVTQQLIRRKDVRTTINSSSLGDMKETLAGKFMKKMNKRYTRRWQGTKLASNCMIAGSAADVSVSRNCNKEFMLAHCEAPHLDDLKEVLRVDVNGDRFYGKKYMKMRKRTCHIALCDDGKMVDVDIFLWNKQSNIVYFYGRIIEVANLPHVYEDVASHILLVNITEDVLIKPVQHLKEKLCFITVEKQNYVCRVPNKHIGVLK